jgi:hypothetical protein
MAIRQFLASEYSEYKMRLPDIACTDIDFTIGFFNQFSFFKKIKRGL